MLNYKQAIDQGFSHDILYQLLATAEAYALGSDNPQRQFKGYEFLIAHQNQEENSRSNF